MKLIIIIFSLITTPILYGMETNSKDYSYLIFVGETEPDDTRFREETARGQSLLVGHNPRIQCDILSTNLNQEMLEEIKKYQPLEGFEKILFIGIPKTLMSPLPLSSTGGGNLAEGSYYAFFLACKSFLKEEGSFIYRGRFYPSKEELMQEQSKTHFPPPFQCIAYQKNKDKILIPIYQLLNNNKTLSLGEAFNRYQNELAAWIHHYLGFQEKPGTKVGSTDYGVQETEAGCFISLTAIKPKQGEKGKFNFENPR